SWGMPPVMFSVVTKYHKGRHSLFLYNLEIFCAFTQDILRSLLFSQGAKLLSIITITGFTGINLQRLWFIIPAAILGGLLGSQMSRILYTKYVEIVFQGMLVLVILINFYNGLMIFV
ncbi:hypothetical protein NQ006_07080, partial [Pediococcus pentosaceus]|nr:hypothetical protein [Pediococcus pentosaceus]